MVLALFQIIMILLNVLWWIIIVQAIMSWLIAFNVINTYNDFVRSIVVTLDRLSEPLLRPIRRVVPPLGGVDLSSLALILILIGFRDYLIPGVVTDLLL